METIEKIIKSATVFHEELKKDKNGRYRSWEYCYKIFHDARGADHFDTTYLDFLSLHLAFYLASWGMYRGSSFLLQKDYKVHIEAIKTILQKDYDCLLEIKCSEYRDEEKMKTLMNLVKELKRYYEEVRKTVIETEVKNELSNTLITKILMGTLGCVPAYDRYFIDGARKEKVTTGNFNERSLLKLVDFYETNTDALEACRKKLKVQGLPYPQMKLLDMGLWQIGFENNPDKGLQIAH